MVSILPHYSQTLVLRGGAAWNASVIPGNALHVAPASDQHPHRHPTRVDADAHRTRSRRYVCARWPRPPLRDYRIWMLGPEWRCLSRSRPRQRWLGACSC
jgi:hypothetical protein